MRKIIAALILVMLIAPLAGAQGLKLGVGGFGGANVPIAQEDQKAGTAFGLMGKVRVLPFMIAVPNVTFGKWGAPDPVEGIDLGIDGSKITSFGIDALVGIFRSGAGIKPYGLVGAGIFSIKNDDTGYDESKLGYTAGLGVGIGLAPTFDLDIQGKAVIAPQEKGSKKAVFITGGLTYYFNFGY